ncbi:MAG: dephospho-CoA kinase [Idiomarina sp.]
MMVVGVTGGIGSGKTTVTDLFAAHGITVVDADVVARAIVMPGQPCLQRLQNAFGDDVLTQDGSLNRAWLRDKIFSDNTAKKQVNDIMHPAIRTELLRQLHSADSPYVILSAPLLVENQLTKLCNRVLVVDVTTATQRQRTLARDGVSAAQVDAILAAQASRAERLAAADDVIDNNGPVNALTEQVAQLHQQYLSIATST